MLNLCSRSGVTHHGMGLMWEICLGRDKVIQRLPLMEVEEKRGRRSNGLFYQVM